MPRVTKPPITAIQTIMLFPADLKALARFYEDVLGFPIREDLRDEGWIVFDGGGVEIAMHHPVSTGTGGQPKIIFQSTDFESMLEYLRSKKVLVGKIKPFEAGRFFDASGPDGHEFRFVQRQ